MADESASQTGLANGAHPGPRHVAIIMDGNGRWAASRGLARWEGHRAGVAAVRRTLEACSELGIETLTLFSFSSENWKRPAEEVSALMALLCESIHAHKHELIEQGIRLRVIGDLTALPQEPRRAIEGLLRETACCASATLCLALNYGSRGEIIRAVRSIARDAAAGALKPESIDESMIDARLDTAGLPDPDLLIRTAGEMRISNFLLWQISYTELHVTDTLWPDFGTDDLRAAIEDYRRRERRYGGVSPAASS